MRARRPTATGTSWVYGDTAVRHKTAVDVLVRAGGALLVGYRASGAERAGRAAHDGR